MKHGRTIKMVKNECSQCRKAKNRIASLLRSNPSYQNVITDDESSKAKFEKQKISEWLPEKDYWPDVYCEKASEALMFDDIPLMQFKFFPVIIEVDHKTHKSKMATVKDNRRDKHFLTHLQIPTVRFNLEAIVGRNTYPDSDLMWLIEKEIEYQLQGYNVEVKYPKFDQTSD